jgi:hypothetical protein
MSMPTYLGQLPVAERDQQLRVFIEEPAIAALRWPEEVVEQWLYHHGDEPSFLRDYETVDLSTVGWTLDAVDVADLADIPTGPGDQIDVLEEFRAEHRYYLGLRPPEVRDAWNGGGTWLVPPILLARSVLDPAASGLQVVEGRMRVGILQGRYADGLHVAPRHAAWVGRLRA